MKLKLQYSYGLKDLKIESGKTDPAFASIAKIAKALGVELADLFNTDTILKDVNSLDKSLMEKMALIEQLDKKEKTAFYSVLDAFIGKYASAKEFPRANSAKPLEQAGILSVSMNAMK